MKTRHIFVAFFLGFGLVLISYWLLTLTSVTYAQYVSNPEISPVMKNYDDGQQICTSVYTVTNEAASPSTYGHEFYDNVQGGSVIHTIQDIIPAFGTRTYDLADLGSIPDGYRGRVIIQSDQPFTATLASCFLPPIVEAWQLEISPVMKNYNDGQQICTSIYTVTNEAVSPGNYFHEFYDSVQGGSVIHTVQDTISASGKSTYNLADIDSVTYGYRGRIVIQSDEPFTATSSCRSTPLLDLPIAYPPGQFHSAFSGNINGEGPGRVNSWFDHSYPTYEYPPNSNNNNLTRWDGPPVYSPADDIGVSWYDGHDGIDFSPNQSNEPIYAAAPGTVVLATFTCQIGDSDCGNFLGNQVWIDHGNGYATVYAHLKQPLVGPGWVVTESNIQSQPIGIMGKTGNVIGADGTHLHFGLYFDPNEQWGFRYTLDPYGWWDTTADPWSNQAGMRSSYMWKYPGMSSLTLDSTGGTLTSLSSRVSVTVPNGAVSSPISLQLLETSPAADPSSQLRSAGTSFWLRSGNSVAGNSEVTQYVTADFTQPITLQVNYSFTGAKHLDKDSLSVYRFDESSTSWIALAGAIDTSQQQVTAQTTQVGKFDLQGDLLCPTDSYEPNDNYHSAELISTNTITITSLFDIEEDEDWFWIDAQDGKNYQVETINLTSGVDTILQLYDFGGDVLLDSDDNSGAGAGSLLEWTASANTTYFIRVSQASGSTFGCNASYELMALDKDIEAIYLPIILK